MRLQYKLVSAEISPLKWFLSRVDHHVISERVLLPQHLATDVAGVFLLQEYLVLMSHVTVLGSLPPVPGTDGTEPLFMGNLLELCNNKQVPLYFDTFPLHKLLSF